MAISIFQTKFRFNFSGIMILFIIFLSSEYAQGFPTNLTSQKNSLELVEMETDKFTSASRVHIEEMLGRKLKLKERILVRIAQKKLAKGKANTSKEALDQAQMETYAIIGFVCGILGIFFLPLLLSIPAIVFSAIALKRIQKEPKQKKGRGLAIAGLVMGIVGTLLGLVGLLFLLFFFLFI